MLNRKRKNQCLYRRATEGTQRERTTRTFLITGRIIISYLLAVVAVSKGSWVMMKAEGGRGAEAMNRKIQMIDVGEGLSHSIRRVLQWKGVDLHETADAVAPLVVALLQRIGAQAWVVVAQEAVVAPRLIMHKMVGVKAVVVTGMTDEVAAMMLEIGAM
jgi:hypothetical protein